MSDDLSFEKAYARLEEILTKMNSGHISLEDSLSLYEEADKLISKCTTKLDHAEKKIRVLMKNRDQSLQKDEDGNPVTKELEDLDEQILMRDSEN